MTDAEVEEKIARGKKAKELLKARVAGSVAVWCEFLTHKDGDFKKDKYGRWLVILHIEGVGENLNWNDWLLEHSYGVSFMVPEATELNLD